MGLEPLTERGFKFQSLGGCKLAAYLSSYNQHKYCQLAEKYKLLVKLPFGMVGLVLAVQPYYISSTLYSSFSLIISSGGAIFIYCSLNWDFLYYISRSLLNTLCIAYSSSNFS